MNKWKFAVGVCTCFIFISSFIFSEEQQTYLVPEAGVYLDLPAAWDIPNVYGNIETLPLEIKPGETITVVALLFPKKEEDIFSATLPEIQQFFIEKDFTPQLELENPQEKINKLDFCHCFGALQDNTEQTQDIGCGLVLFDAPQGIFALGLYGTGNAEWESIGEKLEQSIHSVRLTANIPEE